MAFKFVTVFGLLVAAASAQNTLGLSYEQAKYGGVDPYHNVSNSSSVFMLNHPAEGSKVT